MYTTIAYYESQDGGGALHNLAACADDHVTVSGDDVRIPRGMPNIIGEVGLSAATTLTKARLVSPSLRRIANLEIEPLINALVFGSPPEGILHPDNPTPLEADESMQFQIDSDNTGANVEYGIVMLADGPRKPINGNIYSISAVASITLAAGLWVNGALTFSQVMGVGEYEIVGMRVRGANLVAARLNFVGYSHRPGVLAINAIGDQDHPAFRYGGMGSLGRFHSTNPPTLECLGVSDSSQNVILDVIKLS